MGERGLAYPRCSLDQDVTVRQECGDEHPRGFFGADHSSS